jgi:RNA polymerase sigma-70 factor (sigma-E family)
VSSSQEDEFRAWAVLARPRLRRTAFLLCGDWHLAEDLTQDTLVRVYAVWPRVSTSGAPDAYAVRTLVNCGRATARRPWRRERATDDLPDQAGAVSAVDARDERDVLLTALAALGGSQRAIVVLRYWEDLSVDEVARVLGVSTGTVKSQSARGLSRLRTLLGDAAPVLLETGEPS